MMPVGPQSPDLSPCRFERWRSSLPRVERNVVFQLLREDRMQEPVRNPALCVEQVTAENLAAASSFRSQGVVGVFRQFLAEREIGVYANCSGQVVGHAWAAIWHGAERLVCGYLPVDERTACIHFCSVSPAYRGRKIYQHMLVELVSIVLASTPVRRILISCAFDNLPSSAAIERVGFRRVTMLFVVQWKGRTLCLIRLPKRAGNQPRGAR